MDDLTQIPRESMNAPIVSKVLRYIAWVCFSVLMMGSAGLFAWQTLFKGPPPPTWDWLKVCLIEAGLLTACVWLGLRLYRLFGTRLSLEGVTVPTLRGSSFVPWSDLKLGTPRGYEIRLEGRGRTIEVNLACYWDAGQVAKFISESLQRSAV